MSAPVSSSARPLIITGGSRGIGAATARLASGRGYAICLGYRKNRAAADDVVRGIRDGGGTAIAVACDVAVEADVLRLFETSDRELGPLAGLVNNAGVVDAKARVETMSADRLQRMFATNVIGSILCAREAVRRMSTRHGGRGGAIVNVSSAAARRGSADEYVDYAASKGAIDTFTLGLAREVAMDGIRVNAVRPGIVETEIHASGGQPDRVARIGPLVPMQRAGRADEIAHAILWLMSDESPYTTGALLDVSGGR